MTENSDPATEHVHCVIDSLVSVIMPVYNRADLISRAIRSVLDQSHAGWEMIIVDDGSSDAVGDVVAGFDDPRIRFVRCEKNRGIAAARNTGIDMAGGEYLAFLDSDDEYLPGKLEKSLQAFREADPGVGLVYSNMWVVTPDGERRLFLNRKGPEGRIHLKLLRRSLLQVGAAVMRSDSVSGLRFDTIYDFGEDRDYLIRVCRECDTVFINEPLIVWYNDDRPRQMTRSDRPSLLARRDAIWIVKFQPELNSMPVTHAGYRYRLGRYQVLHGQVGLGRRYLRSAILRWPFSPRPWLLLLSSCLDVDIFMFLRKVYHRLKKVP